MGARKLSWHTRHSFSKMLGDRTIQKCSLDGIHVHSKITKEVYAYRMSYQGNYSVVRLDGYQPQDWGTQNIIKK